MLLKPTRTIPLEYHASFVSRFPGRSLFVAAAQWGYIYLFDLAEETPTARLLPGTFGKIEAISPHPSEPRLALIEDGSVVLLDLEGVRYLRINAAEGMTFAACSFDPQEPYLWCVAWHSGDIMEIQLRDRENGTLIACCSQEDPCSGIYCLLYPTTPNPGLALWLAAQQDGQQLYWLRRTSDGISCVKEPRIKNTTPPVFSPSGKEFLVMKGDFLQRYAYPSQELLGELLYPWGGFCLGLCYVDEERVLVLSNAQRLYILDLTHETTIDELIMAGTDIYEIYRFDDWIVVNLWRVRRTILTDWDHYHALLCLPASTLTNPIAL